MPAKRTPSVTQISPGSSAEGLHGEDLNRGLTLRVVPTVRGQVRVTAYLDGKKQKTYRGSASNVGAMFLLVARDIGTVFGSSVAERMTTILIDSAVAELRDLKR